MKIELNVPDIMADEVMDYIQQKYNLVLTKFVPEGFIEGDHPEAEIKIIDGSTFNEKG